MAPVARVTAFAKHSINFNRRNLASQTIPLDVAIQQWELLVLDLILSGLRILVTNRKGFLKPSHMAALCFLICFGQATWDQSMCLSTVACLIVMEADCQAGVCALHWLSLPLLQTALLLPSALSLFFFASSSPSSCLFIFHSFFNPKSVYVHF